MSYKNILNFKERIQLLSGYLPGKFKKLLPGYIRELDQSCKRILFQGGKISILDQQLLAEFSQFKFFLRPKSTDFLVFDQVILDEEYKPIIEEILKTKGPNSFLNIIDAGANVGYASLYFNKTFPNAKIFALEPDQDNFNALKKNINLNKLEDIITPLNIGIWGYDTMLKIDNSFRDGREWSLNLIETQNVGDIECFSLESIMEMAKLNTVDFLKIDIEGGEKNLFDNWASNGNILKKVSYIAIEIHDETADRNFINLTLQKNSFQITQIGETTFGKKR